MSQLEAQNGGSIELTKITGAGGAGGANYAI